MKRNKNTKAVGGRGRNGRLKGQEKVNKFIDFRYMEGCGIMGCNPFYYSEKTLAEVGRGGKTPSKSFG